MTQQNWILLSSETRRKLAEKFHLKRDVPTRVDGNRLICDGYSQKEIDKVILNSEDYEQRNGEPTVLNISRNTFERSAVPKRIGRPKGSRNKRTAGKQTGSPIADTGAASGSRSEAQGLPIAGGAL